MIDEVTYKQKTPAEALADLAAEDRRRSRSSSSRPTPTGRANRISRRRSAMRGSAKLGAPPRTRLSASSPGGRTQEVMMATGSQTTRISRSPGNRSRASLAAPAAKRAPAGAALHLALDHRLRLVPALPDPRLDPLQLHRLQHDAAAALDRPGQLHPALHRGRALSQVADQHRDLRPVQRPARSGRRPLLRAAAQPEDSRARPSFAPPSISPPSSRASRPPSSGRCCSTPRAAWSTSRCRRSGLQPIPWLTSPTWTHAVTHPAQRVGHRTDRRHLPGRVCRMYRATSTRPPSSTAPGRFASSAT